MPVIVHLIEPGCNPTATYIDNNNCLYP